MNKGYQKILDTGRDLDSFTYQWVKVKCGKAQCKSCPHCCYLYARWREGNKVRSIYLGRYAPEELKDYVK